MAKTLLSEANFLLLDEPTNHLDMQSVNILIQALQQYQGTYITISHDRHFVAQVANKIWYIEEHQLKEYPGPYDEYVTWKEQREKNEKNSPKISIPEKKKASNVLLTDRKNITNELKTKQNLVQKTEERILALEQQLKKIETELAKPSVYGNVDLLHQINSEYELIKEQLEKEQVVWEKQLEEIDLLAKN
jgi:ATP-binding cassette, subfamily F, member 3